MFGAFKFLTNPGKMTAAVFDKVVDRFNDKYKVRLTGKLIENGFTVDFDIIDKNPNDRELLDALEKEGK